MNAKLINVFSLILIIISITCSIFIQNYAFNRRAIKEDQLMHFYDMKKWYKSGKLPNTGACFNATAAVNEEFNTPRVPGGIYYIFFTLFYKLGNESLYNARFINLIFALFILSIFLIWFYKKFGIFIISIASALILCNPYVIMSITDFWNPNITLLFSFLFFILLFEYIGNDNERIKKISASLSFPTLAIMAQGHFTVFSSMVPTLIVYLIIRFKNTRKYLPYWILSVFISFLFYLPYLAHEIKTGFLNLNYAINMRSELLSLPFPQIYFILLFPTNEMSSVFGTRIGSIIYFWFAKPIYFFGMIFLATSVLFSSFVFIKSLIFLLGNKSKAISKKYTLKEITFILILFVPITVICFIAFKSKSGTFHYLYSAYSISFAPMILFFVLNEEGIKNNVKALSLTFALLTLNLFSMTGQLIRYFNLFEAPRNYKSHYELVQFLEKESKDANIYIYDNFSGVLRNQYIDIFNTYFPNHKINFSPDSKIIYAIKDNVAEKNWTANRIKNDMKYLIDNDAIKLTNINGFTIYKLIKKGDK